MVDDDLHVESALLDHSLNGFQVDPQVVGVEDSILTLSVKNLDNR